MNEVVGSQSLPATQYAMFGRVPTCPHCSERHESVQFTVLEHPEDQTTPHPEGTARSFLCGETTVWLGWPPTEMCANCWKHAGTQVFSEGAIAYVHGMYEKFCDCCVLDIQIVHARAAVARLADLEAQRATLVCATEPVPAGAAR